MKVRTRLMPEEAKSLGLEVKSNDEGRDTARYYITQEQRDFIGISDRKKKSVKKAKSTKVVDDPKPFVLSAWNFVTGKMLDIDEYCEFYSLPREDVKSYKLVSHTGTPFFNILFRENTTDNKEPDLVNLLSESIEELYKGTKPIKTTVKDIDSSYLFDVSVFTDTHIAMNPNPNGYGLYGGKWDEYEVEERLSIYASKIIENKKSNKLILFDLGDFMDGWDGETVRKGHELPQNMDNEKAFDVGLSFKVRLIDELVKHYSQIDVINICDDNHSGSFSYVVNSSFKKFIEYKYNNVNITNQRKFINHYVYGNKVFVSTHGKDGKNLKFGFKPKLDAIQIEKIENYLYDNNLVSKDLEIYFIKGDSHQDIFDNSTSQKFKYWNFPAFSPSSNWVQTNFKKGISGFYNFNFKEDCYHSHPYYFKWK